tara:strand:+ start:633 stop:1385 length:753 start_codon:yes stop_codon:yes gene_type:complete
MKVSSQQITSRGIEQQSGLEVFNTVTTYNGEYINWGNALAYGSQLGSDVSALVSGDALDAQVEALTSSPPSASGQWLRYNTLTGTKHYIGVPPTSGGGYFTLNAASSGAKLSYAGMYQKMPLVVGLEYKIDISNTINSNIGTLYVDTYFPRYNESLGEISYKLNTSESVNYPVGSLSDCILTSSFTAKSPNDVIVIYFTTTAASSSIDITNISIKEKREDLIPIYATDMWGNANKVLRVAADQIISTDET